MECSRQEALHPALAREAGRLALVVFGLALVWCGRAVEPPPRPRGTITSLQLPSGVVPQPRDGSSADELSGIAVDGDGTVYVADISWGAVYRIRSDGTADALIGGSASAVIGDGVGNAVRFWDPGQLGLDGHGNLFVPDIPDGAIQVIELASATVSTVAGRTAVGFRDGTTSVAEFDGPMGIAPSGDGRRIYIADTRNNVVRRVDLDASTVVTIAGSPAGGYADGPGARALLNQPASLAFDPRGDLWVNDAGNRVIRRIDLHDRAFGVTTISGRVGMSGYAEGPAEETLFGALCGMALGPDGTMFVADAGNRVVRSVAPNGTTNLVAGTPLPIDSNLPPGIDGAAADAVFTLPCGIAVGGDGTIYVADVHAVRRIRR